MIRKLYYSTFRADIFNTNTSNEGNRMAAASAVYHEPPLMGVTGIHQYSMQPTVNGASSVLTPNGFVRI